MLNAKMLTTVNPQCWHKKFKKNHSTRRNKYRSKNYQVVCPCKHCVGRAGTKHAQISPP